MTNNEKFFKTFGVKLREHADLCDLCICDKRGCLDCPLGEHSFEYDEYKAPGNTFSNDIPFEDTKQSLLDALSKHSGAAEICGDTKVYGNDGLSGECKLKTERRFINGY